MPADSYFVFDTNVVISALLLKRSVSRQAFDKALTEGKLIISLATINELNEVLKRKKFDKYVRENERMQFFTALVRAAKLVKVSEVVTECRDPQDNRILELAVSGKALCIVSGDQDLLVLHPFRGIPIVSPRSFLDYSWNLAPH